MRLHPDAQFPWQGDPQPPLRAHVIEGSNPWHADPAERERVYYRAMIDGGERELFPGGPAIASLAIGPWFTTRDEAQAEADRHALALQFPTQAAGMLDFGALA